MSAEETPVDELVFSEQEIISHYTAREEESKRLYRTASGMLELARSQQLVTRHVPPPPKIVLDVGGGPGVYSLWLARKGYEVHLIDIVPRHLEEAREASRNQPEHPIASVSQGDARSLAQSDVSCDVVLLMGPLYHLTNHIDRIRALREANRVLRPGGLVFASAINRFASLVDGLRNGFIDDPYFVEILERDLAEGQHRNPRRVPEYFTNAHSHLPEELEIEISEAGFAIIETVALQGPGWLAQDFLARWDDPRRRAQLLNLIGKVEHEPGLMGISYHFMTIARK
jgi:ubiquinone/menaquinone biosynthesis C-methylase UbiE